MPVRLCMTIVYETVQGILSFLLPYSSSPSTQAECQPSLPPEDFPCLSAVKYLKRAVTTSVSPYTSDSAPVSSLVTPNTSYLSPVASVFTSAYSATSSSPAASVHDWSPPSSNAIRGPSAPEREWSVSSSYKNPNLASILSYRTPSPHDSELWSTFDVRPASSITD